MVSFLLVTVLAALATAHFATVQKNSRQSGFIDELGDLRRYAESGVRLSIHELTYEVSGSDGRIGTELWTAANDIGRDGKPATGDEGEGDGIPTPGEPNIIASSAGPSSEGIGLFVHAVDTSWPNVKRIVSTAFGGSAYASVEVYARATPRTIPGTGAVFVQPGLILDIKGNSFLISGNDTSPGGAAGPQPAVLGIATSPGAPPGSNASDIIDQVPVGYEDQVIGSGGIPSVGETPALDFDEVFNAFKASQTNTIAPGSYDNVIWGDYATADHQVTYCSGDLHLSGDGRGAGVLIVEGAVTFSGRFEFVGLVIVRGDVRMTGGGSGIHIYGSLMVGKSISAIDPDLDLNMTGNADVVYSSVGLATAASLLSPNYSVLYWNDLK